MDNHVIYFSVVQYGMCENTKYADMQKPKEVEITFVVFMSHITMIATHLIMLHV